MTSNFNLIETMHLSCTIFELLSLISGKLKTSQDRDHATQGTVCDAMLSTVYAVVVCLCVCLCVSVTLRYCIKIAKRRITHITPHDSHMTLVF